MAFLGDFGKTFHKVIRNPVFQAVFPVVAIANIAAEKVASAALQRPSFAEGKPAQTAREVGGARTEFAPQGFNYGPDMPYGGYQFGGGGAWDFSTGSETSWQTWEPLSFPAEETSAGVNSQATSWEGFLRTSLSQ